MLILTEKNKVESESGHDSMNLVTNDTSSPENHLPKKRKKKTQFLSVGFKGSSLSPFPTYSLPTATTTKPSV